MRVIKNTNVHNLLLYVILFFPNIAYISNSRIYSAYASNSWVYSANASNSRDYSPYVSNLRGYSAHMSNSRVYSPYVSNAILIRCGHFFRNRCQTSQLNNIAPLIASWGNFVHICPNVAVLTENPHCSLPSI